MAENDDDGRKKRKTGHDDDHGENSFGQVESSSDEQLVESFLTGITNLFSSPDDASTQEQPARPATLAPPQSPEPAGGHHLCDTPTCAGCGSGIHKLIACLKVGPDGLMKGCPWCNTLGHSFDQCPSTKNNIENQLYLVMLRPNMPSFQQTQSWVNAVRAVFGDGPVHLKDFPWTPNFAKKIAPVTLQFQAYIDTILSTTGVYKGNVTPVDPATRDWDSVQQTYASM